MRKVSLNKIARHWPWIVASILAVIFYILLQSPPGRYDNSASNRPANNVERNTSIQNAASTRAAVQNTGIPSSIYQYQHRSNDQDAKKPKKLAIKKKSPVNHTAPPIVVPMPPVPPPPPPITEPVKPIYCLDGQNLEPSRFTCLPCRSIWDVSTDVVCPVSYNN